MLTFIYTTPYNDMQSNISKVRVHLRTGIAEVYTGHSDLIGLIDGNCIEFHTNFENKTSKEIFAVQEGVFIVSNKGLDVKMEPKDTCVYTYARRVIQIGKNIPMDALQVEYETIKTKFEAQPVFVPKPKDPNRDPKVPKTAEQIAADTLEFLRQTRYMRIRDDVAFLREAVMLAKRLK
jgi:hypothetical protein